MPQQLNLSKEDSFTLGQCEALIKALSAMPKTTQQAEELEGYCRQLEQVPIKPALIKIKEGLTDLQAQLNIVATQATWKHYIRSIFDEMKGNEAASERKRTLALEMPLYKDVALSEIADLSITLAKLYSGLSEKTLQRDADELVALEIFKKVGKKYRAHVGMLHTRYTAERMVPRDD